MKKLILLFLFAGLMASCGTTKIERQATRTFKGDWTLTSITYPGSSGFVDVTLFGDASTNCLLHSDWHFISNNNKGSYTISKSKCAPGKRTFRWNVAETNPDSGLYDFTLKPVAKGENPRRIEAGYRLNLVSLSADRMVWEETVSFDGKPFHIRMTFSKTQ